MKATLEVAHNPFGNLESDLDGDGEIDEVWTPDGERVVDDSPTQYGYEDLQDVIDTIDNQRVASYLERLAHTARRFRKWHEINPQFEKLERIVLNKMQRLVGWLERREKIDEQVFEELEVIIRYLNKE